MKDITIVGGGPIGCFLGENLANRGFEVLILEEDGEIGQPMCCTGIVGASGLLEETGLDPEVWSVNELGKGYFHSPSGETLELDRGDTEAYVIARSEFDRDLAERAVRAGADLLVKNKCVDVSLGDDKAILKTKSESGIEEIESRLVIGADGPNSFLARKLDLLKDFDPLVGVQAEIVKNKKEECAQVYLDKDLSQDFFGWIVPAGDVYRIGLADRGSNVRKKLLEFIKNNPSLPQNAENKIVRLTTGLIPRAGTRKMYRERTLLVGDAAGQIKPLTGGGLYIGLSCAFIASKIAEKGLENKPSKEILKEYEKKVSEKFGQEFKLGNRIMNVFKKMTNEDLNELIQFLNEPKIRESILEHSEFDKHSSILKKLVKKGPSILKNLGIRKSFKFLKWFASD